MIKTVWENLFILATIAQFAFGLVITAISYWAYRSSGKKSSLRNATIGFLCITIGGVLAPIYELVIKRDFLITGQELLKLQILEGTVIGIGLALLLFSVYSYDTGVESWQKVTATSNDDQQRDRFHGE